MWVGWQHPTFLGPKVWFIRASSSHSSTLIAYHPSYTHLTNHLIFLIFMWLGHMSPLGVQAGKLKQKSVLQPILQGTIYVVSPALHGAIVMGTGTTYPTSPSYRCDRKVIQDKEIPLNNRILNDMLNVLSICCISCPEAMPCCLWFSSSSHLLRHHCPPVISAERGKAKTSRSTLGHTALLLQIFSPVSARLKQLSSYFTKNTLLHAAACISVCS